MHLQPSVSSPHSPALSLQPSVSSPQSPALNIQPSISSPQSPALTLQPSVSSPKSPALNLQPSISSPQSPVLTLKPSFSSPQSPALSLQRSPVIERLVVRGSQVAIKHVIHDMVTRTLLMELRRRAIKRWVPCGDMDRRLKILHPTKVECGFQTTPEECL